MDPSRSRKRCLLLLISYISPWPGTFITSSTHHSYLLIAKSMHMGPTTRGHLLTLSKGKKNMKLKGSLIISVPAVLEPSNTSSSAQDTRKQITPVNQLTKFILHNLFTPITDSS